MTDFKTPLPLVELHCHIEGTVSPEMALKLARRHNIDLSHILDGDGNYLASDFAEFIKSYDAMAQAIRTAQDYFDLTYDYYAKAAKDGLCYGEIFFSPAHPEPFGLTYEAYVDTLSAVADKLEADFGLIVRYILTCVRHEGVEHAEATARFAEKHPHPKVVGFGMAGHETQGHASEFKKAFDIAEGAGLHLTCHAGELAGPESIRAALDAFSLKRIGHGVRCHEDPELVTELADRQIPLELCPSSNVFIGIFGSLDDHPFRDYFDQGLKVTLNTDDPAFFDTDIRREYERIADTHNLSPADLLTISRNAVDAAFCDDATKQRLKARLDDWADNCL